MAYQPTGGASASETPTLLWENPNPTSAFSAQTVNIDLTDYENIIINCRVASDEARYQSSLITKGSYQVVSAYSTSQSKIFSRYCNISDSAISFSTGFSSGGSTAISLCIPQKIWGLKKGII